ncbi:MAG: 50S ribosomal protein L29 [Candidatus Thioglobus sp.]|jgi:large subunit ribosomal protein L29|uniref:50S ribosomal protein L29 n=1 Tax=Candidatus Thioglobus sp. TaxID=2026721 RepID=UPI001DEFA7F6|nr:50S ribosomal protein L29 [Candidatus Thioglobus sp.]MBT3186681.1 50S ribosomal protein L29 [Candidatus Thioglobus sp.]MBT3431940.1 50S ribosomal protein L29 [Candidatus Thioglobus sp.]MBT3965273.1 50S ribosomal protein L29 [Candidatus Thioglobus sp.]MBT4316092.1 50S ribosomal protein L29 [Candidatus Thioglobus sp.]MBT4553866.1 50S ribosomal protein L29 [Candidatus Thioglobus sp.]
MDIKELRDQDAKALNETLMTLLKEHFELRMQHKSAQLSDPTKLGKTKRSIAQVKTIMKEKQA